MRSGSSGCATRRCTDTNPASSNPPDVEPTLYRRYLTIFLDGMRADRGPLTALPVAALNTEQTHTTMTPSNSGNALTTC